jgi:D-lactate dehydrogenase (cytochrome)
MLPSPSPPLMARAATIESVRRLLSDRLSTDLSVRERHGKDTSYLVANPPDAVAFPHSTEEVSAIVKICAEHKTPIIPFGAGTGVEGHILALCGGICIDLSGMNRILRVSTGDLDATVEAGVTHEQLNEHLSDKNLFFPVDPGANATLGGMAATRASGTNSVRYGTMRENVLSLTVVLPDGRIIRTAHRARKSAAGYDLTRLFIGSEGTLGVITQVTVRLYGNPVAVSAAVCSFPNLEAAVNVVIETIQAGISVARIELANATQMDAINRYLALRPGGQLFPTDVCVPISRLAECISATEKDIANSFLTAPIVGHAGDGNFHVAFLIDPSDSKELAEARRLNKLLVERALSMDGTCTGEHGIGCGKIDSLVAEHGEAITVMRTIKQALDPDNIMNPGKMLVIDEQ